MNIGGSFTEGGLWHNGKVEAAHGQWIVTLETFSTKNSGTWTRIRAPYINPDGFKFTIYRRGILSNLGKRFGMQDVQVGFPQFDEDFIIQGNNKVQLRRFFADARLRDLISAQPDIHFCVQEDEDNLLERTKFPAGRE